MALDTPWLVAAAVLLLAAILRFAVAIWIRWTRESSGVLDDAERSLIAGEDEESKLQLLSELEAALENEQRPASETGSQTISACSAETLRLVDEKGRVMEHQNLVPMYPRQTGVPVDSDMHAFLSTPDQIRGNPGKANPDFPKAMWRPREFPLPIVNGEDAPVFVNAKQFHRILKRREARAQLEESARLRLSQQKNGMALRERARVDYGTVSQERKGKAQVVGARF